MDVYMDHAAATGTCKEALNAMLPWFCEQYGNPSSLHHFGFAAKKAMQCARKKLAGLLSCEMNELYFTAGGTEADNWAIKGYLLANQNRGKHVITSSIEHPAVLRTCEYMKKFGYELTILPVSKEGRISPECVREAIRPDTALISIQYANNEIGTIQPIAEIGAIAEQAKVAFHTDAVQAVGQLPISLKDLPVTMLSASSHKFGGPKGCGFLYVKDGTVMEPLLHGGPQEKRLRAGTENVPAIIGTAAALEISCKENRQEVAKLRDYLKQRILESIPDVRLNGSTEECLPGSLSVSFGGVEATALLVYLDLAGIAASGGSACSSAENRPSEVLQAIGAEEPYLSGTIRFTLNADNTYEEADYVVKTLQETVKKLRR